MDQGGGGPPPAATAAAAWQAATVPTPMALIAASPGLGEGADVRVELVSIGGTYIPLQLGFSACPKRAQGAPHRPYSGSLGFPGTSNPPAVSLSG